jgi:hypothetical protein
MAATDACCGLATAHLTEKRLNPIGDFLLGSSTARFSLFSHWLSSWHSGEYLLHDAQLARN